MYDTGLSCGEIKGADEDVREEIRRAKVAKTMAQRHSAIIRMHVAGAQFTPPFGTSFSERELELALEVSTSQCCCSAYTRSAPEHGR